MPVTVRVVDAATERARLAILAVGRELRAARTTRGLSQASVARGAQISQSQLSEIERGLHRLVSVVTLFRVAGAVGLDLGLRAFPGGQPVRDRAHVTLIERFKVAVGPGWRWSSEVPLPIAGDRRAWDRVMRGFGLVIGVEGETRPTDMQELGRRLALKKRDGGVDRLILVMPNSAWCRQVIAMNDLGGAFPVPGKTALAALREGRDPGGDAIVLV